MFLAKYICLRTHRDCILIFLQLQSQSPTACVRCKKKRGKVRKYSERKKKPSQHLTNKRWSVRTASPVQPGFNGLHVALSCCCIVVLHAALNVLRGPQDAAPNWEHQSVTTAFTTRPPHHTILAPCSQRREEGDATTTV